MIILIKPRLIWKILPSSPACTKVFQVHLEDTQGLINIDKWKTFDVKFGEFDINDTPSPSIRLGSTGHVRPIKREVR